MNIIVVSQTGKYGITKPFWECVEGYMDFDHEIVDGPKGLVKFFKDTDLSMYDRVVADTNLRRLGPGYKFLKNAPNLVVFDHDVYQTNVQYAEWHRKYPAAMRDFKNARIIVSGYELSKQLCQLGIDCSFLPKGYDHKKIRFLNMDRDIEAAFVGRTKNKVYRDRRSFLNRIGKRESVPVMRADPGEPYNKLLNRIQVFISADINFGEYMIKNFEAMAAGCLLLAWRQPGGEQRMMGLEDGNNVLLYDNENEFIEKLNWAKANKYEAGVIASKGRELAENQHKWLDRAKIIPDLIKEPIDVSPAPGILDKIRILKIRLV